MKRIIIGILVLVVISTTSVSAQNEEYQYRKISSLVIVNHVGHTIALYVGSEFVDYLSPGERFVYNFALFPNEVFPVEIHALLNEQSGDSYTRTIRYGKNPAPLVFTKKSFSEEGGWVDTHRKVHVVIANEASYDLEIKHEGKLLGICKSKATKSFMVFPGVMLVRSIRGDFSKFIPYSIVLPITLIIRDNDFLFY